METGLLFGSPLLALVLAGLVLSLLAISRGSRPSCWLASGAMALALLQLAVAGNLLYGNGFHGLGAVVESATSLTMIRALSGGSFVASLIGLFAGAISYVLGAENVPDN